MRSREFTVAGNVIVAGGEITVDNAAAVARRLILFSQSGNIRHYLTVSRADPGMVSPQNWFTASEQSPACALGIGSFDFRGPTGAGAFRAVMLLYRNAVLHRRFSGGVEVFAFLLCQIIVSWYTDRQGSWFGHFADT